MREAVYYWKNGAPVYHDVERDHGYLVVTGGGEQYFDEAAAAMRFSAFMEELGYDAVYYDCQIDSSGRERRFERMPEQLMLASVALGL